MLVDLHIFHQQTDALMEEESVKLIKIGEAAKILGVSIDTLRRWEKAGKIQTVRTLGGTRLYPLNKLQTLRGTETDAPIYRNTDPQTNWRNHLSSQVQDPNAIIINVPARVKSPEIPPKPQASKFSKLAATMILLVTCALLIITLPKYLNLSQIDREGSRPSL